MSQSIKLKYPIGKQDFASIRERGFVYIDKTAHIIPLIEGADSYFLCRPRRFGKSLFISTLEHFFLGHRHLFEGLAIDSYPWTWEHYPVIRIDLSGGTYAREDGLSARLWRELHSVEEKYAITGQGKYPGDYLDSLIVKLKNATGKGVVVLVDEYEKPLLDAYGKPHFSSFRDELHDFYSVLKNNEANLRFTFLTGVTRFGHLNIFSGLNNISDISLKEEYSAICGITREELHTFLAEGLQNFADKWKISLEEAALRLKRYYDGYHFSSDLTDIYNPFSVLDCLKDAKLSYNWFQSGSSTYLIERLRHMRFDISEIEDTVASEITLMGVDSSMTDPVTLLYQSGYLTIKRYDPDRGYYTLGLPNLEVSTALYSAIIPYYLGSRHTIDRSKVFEFVDYLYDGKPEKAMEWLRSFFGSIPYDVKLNYEREFQQVIYSFFALAGLLTDTEMEKETSRGRIDLLFSTPKYVYIFEFKIGDSAEAAMEQINSREYALQWESGPRQVIKIGVAFSPATRGISSYLISKFRD